MQRAGPIIALLALAACEPRAGSGGSGQASAGEQRALDEAAEMIARGRPAAPTAAAGFTDAPVPSGRAAPPR